MLELFANFVLEDGVVCDFPIDSGSLDGRLSTYCEATTNRDIDAKMCILNFFLSLIIITV